MPEPLILPPFCMRFGEGEENDLGQLHRQLQSQSITAPIKINSPADVMMRADGTVNKGFRFTPAGLSSLCQRVGPGLSQWISFLAGAREGLREEKFVEPNPDLAIRQLNDGIRHCFSDRLKDHRLIVDPTRKSIEGLVGPKYEFLSNLDWLIQCQELVESSSGGSATFLHAALTGRRFLLRYVSGKTWFQFVAEDGTRTNYRRGWSFSNSETGKSSVRVGLMIVDDTGIGSLRSLGTQTHTASLRKDKGQKLLTKLGEAFDNIDVRIIHNDIVRLSRLRISLGNGVDDLRKLARLMTGQMSKRLPRSLARSVVSLTLSAAALRQPVGVVAGGGSRFTDLLHVPPERTYYHLYHALVTRARQCFPDEQERAEALAYDLLRGRYKPVSLSTT